jgi:hypothetical protein
VPKQDRIRRVIIVDELDATNDPVFRSDMAYFIKQLGDAQAHLKFIFAGIAENVSELLVHHESAQRCMATIKLDRLPMDVLHDIIVEGLKQIGGSSVKDTTAYRVANPARNDLCRRAPRPIVRQDPAPDHREHRGDAAVTLGYGHDSGGATSSSRPASARCIPTSAPGSSRRCKWRPAFRWRTCASRQHTRRSHRRLYWRREAALDRGARCSVQGWVRACHLLGQARPVR